MRLRITWRAAWDLLLRGDLEGRRDSRGRWMVTVASVEAELARRARAAGVTGRA
jgi:hypothetical protein